MSLTPRLVTTTRKERLLAWLLLLLAHAVVLSSWKLNVAQSPQREDRITINLLLNGPARSAPVSVRSGSTDDRPATKAKAGDSGQLDLPAAREPAGPEAASVPGSPGSRLQLQLPAGAGASSGPTLAERARDNLGSTREQTFENSVARSARGDCINAHSNLGLFAIPMLILDAVRDDGCKW